MAGIARFLTLTAPLLMSACVSKAGPPPIIQAGASPPPVVAPPPPPPPDWRDAPETPGRWSYSADAAGSSARFGRGAAAEFELRCDRTGRIVRLSRPGGAGGTMTLKTSYGERSWPAQAAEGRSAISLAAADPVLDQLAFSRGRFSVALDGLPLLILPAWAEPARVIEDCRL